MPSAQTSGKVNELHGVNTSPLPCVAFVFKRNNKENVVLPHTTNTYFFSFEMTALGVHRNLSVS